jgi:hypothetical protein
MSRLQCQAGALLVLLALFSMPAAAAEPLTKAEIARIGKAATVFVKTARGSGSGFCVHSSGVLITNEHVVRGEKEVKVVFDAGLKEQQVFTARVARSDKERDLALLQVDGEDNFSALDFNTTDKLAELADVVAFGFPFGESLTVEKGEYPAISVNSGSVTALRMKAGALHLLQLDVVINPGNSGGPVLDMNGKVVGVVVGQIPGAQVNFAIPAAHADEFLKRPSILFTPPAIKAPDVNRPVEFEARVISVLPLTEPLTVELTLKAGDSSERRIAMLLKDRVYRATAVPVPDDEARRVAILAHFDTGAVAGVVYDRELRAGNRNVKFSDCKRIQTMPKPAVVLTDGTTLEGAITGIDKVAVSVAGHQALTLDLGQAKSVEFAVLAAPAGLDCTLVARTNDKEVARSTTHVPFLGAKPIARSLPGPLVIEPPSLGAKMAVKNLPDIASDVCVGGGGRFLVLHLPKLKKLAVFDVNEAAIARYIPVAEEKIAFAAGMEKLVIGLTPKGLVERWDLQTGEKEMTRPAPGLADVISVVLGSGSHGPVVINGVFHDLDTLRPLPIKTPSGAPSFATPASAGGTVFGGWKTNESPDVSISLVLEGDELKRYEEGGLKHVVPGPDGRAVFTGAGVRTNRLKVWAGGPANAGYCLPATEGRFFLSIGTAEGDRGGRLAVYLLDYEFPLAKDVGFTHSIHFDGWDRTTFGPWKRIFFIPRAELIIIFPESNDRLELHHFDVDEALAKSGLDYLLVTSQPPSAAKRGSEFTYQLVVKSRREDVRYKIGSGPDGMKVSSKGLVRWLVPMENRTDASNVILTISDGSGQEVFHSFELRLID